MSSIARISTHPLSLEMRSALRWGASSRLERLEHVLVRVETHEGYVGIAEAPVRPTIYGETVQSVQAVVETLLAPALTGLELENTEAVQKALASVANNHTARGALDIALHEARAKAAGTTLFEAHRGPQERVRVSYILGVDSLEAMLEEARRVFRAGVSVFKLKIGRDAKQDEAVAKALRHEFSGTDALLYADANETLTPETAHETLTRLAKLGIAYIEEPLPVHRLKARAALKAASILPIIADDSCFTVEALGRELEADTFDILNIKTARTGYTQSLQQLNLARSAGKGVMVGSQASSGLGTLHAALFASKEGVTHPSELSFPLKLKEDSLETSLRYEGGFLPVETLSREAGSALRNTFSKR